MEMLFGPIFRAKMRDESKRVKLTGADNPPEKAPKYPGRWSRNNKSGLAISREEYLQQKTDEWFEYVKENPAYRLTAMAHKALSLYSHLRLSFSKRKRSKVDQDECRMFLENTEARKMNKEEALEDRITEPENRGEQMAVVHRDEEDDLDIAVAGCSGVVPRNIMSESEDDDENWTPRKDRKDRGTKEQMMNEFVQKPTKELFKDDKETEEFQFESHAFKKKKEDYYGDFCAQKTDMELFGPESNISLSVKNSKAYKKRSNQFAKLYLDSKKHIQQSKYVKESLKDITMKERSEMTVIDSVRETLDKLRLNNNRASREQQLVIAAAVTSLEYGVPELGLNRKEEKLVMGMKKKLMQGEDKVLMKPENTIREVFPKGVKEVAVQYWESITTTEPAKHRRVTKAVKDGDETLPTRYQTMTDKEAYQSFYENCTDDIKVLMAEHGRAMEILFSKRPESADKQVMIQLARERVPGKFPSLSWFISQRPREIKPMDDHCTGLCKV